MRLALIGCGAVAELCHLPALSRIGGTRDVILVDRDAYRARSLAGRFGIARTEADYRTLSGSIEAALVALPHALHEPVGCELLRQGVSVLMEKPMALSTKEAGEMIRSAKEGGAVLQPGMMFRFCSGARFVRDAIRNGWLGPLQRFELESGFVYDWPVASGFFFHRAQAGGGVLVDTGSHMLDLLTWWLGRAVEVEYQDDDRGGVEAECVVRLLLEGEAGRVEGRMTLSRIRTLGSRFTLQGEHSTLTCDLTHPDRVSLSPTRWGAGDPPLRRQETATWDDVYTAQLKSFLGAAESRSAPEVSGESVLPGLELMERCYGSRRPLTYSWEPTAS